MIDIPESRHLPREEKPSSTKGFFLFLSIALLLLVLVVHFCTWVHCIVVYNGGRMVQCSYEVLVQDIPDSY